MSSRLACSHRAASAQIPPALPSTAQLQKYSCLKVLPFCTPAKQNCHASAQACNSGKGLLLLSCKPKPRAKLTWLTDLTGLSCRGFMYARNEAQCRTLCQGKGKHNVIGRKVFANSVPWPQAPMRELKVTTFGLQLSRCISSSSSSASCQRPAFSQALVRLL